VPVVQMTKRENRLGGAANVAKNIAWLGAKPILCSVLGNDSKSSMFRSLMEENELPLDGLIDDATRQTTTKTRIISGAQQILRVDQELTSQVSTETTKLLKNRVETLIEQNDVKVVIFEDYDKGVITEELIDHVVGLCRQKGIPTCVDPKKKNFLSYKNVSLFKPNLKELKEGLAIEVDPKNKEDLKDSVRRLQEKLNCETVMITLSNHGVFIGNNHESFHYPAHLRRISDVSGAGDTVISVAGLCLALGMSIDLIAKLSNIAGGMVCEKVGVVPLSYKEFQNELDILL
ncbi:MAG: bifunctional ADP-heptose synthase, partial [Flavobacteriales bacterium]|nr:bifunctional ADP-heptose synthase [Flavobacteriales bacterium]